MIQQSIVQLTLILTTQMLPCLGCFHVVLVRVITEDMLELVG